MKSAAYVSYLCWRAVRCRVAVPQLPVTVTPFKAQTPRVQFGFNGHDGHVRSSNVDTSRGPFLLLLKKVKRAWPTPSAPHKSGWCGDESYRATWGKGASKRGGKREEEEEVGEFAARCWQAGPGTRRDVTPNIPAKTYAC